MPKQSQFGGEFRTKKMQDARTISGKTLIIDPCHKWRCSVKEELMSIHYAPLNYSGSIPGAGRGHRGLGFRLRAAHAFDAARAWSSLLLAAVVAALLVLANQAVESWTNGNLLTAWMLLWVFAFAALALLAAPSRLAAASLRAVFKRWNDRRLQAEQDEQYWLAAESDPRIMAEIRRAMGEPALPEPGGYAYYAGWRPLNRAHPAFPTWIAHGLSGL